MNETMTPAERINAAIALEQPDRVPVAPLFIYFLAHYDGIGAAEFLRDPDKQVAAAERAFARLGGWDAWYAVPGLSTPTTLKFLWPMEVRVPGEGLPEDAPLTQLHEREVMTPEDYDAIVADGWDQWYAGYYQRLYPGRDLRPQLRADMRRTQETLMAFYQRWEVERQVPLLQWQRLVVPAVEVFSFGRTFYQFALDLATVPEKVTRAAEVATEAIIRRTVGSAGGTRGRKVWVSGWRSGSGFLSPRQCAAFVLPNLKRLLEAMVGEGITPVLHFDAEWTRVLHLLRQLPAKKCLLALDQLTDMYKAKEILGDHTCLMGNIAPQLLALGTVDEVVAECRRLIEVVGKGGGFILSSGCEVPYNAKPENVAAMLEVAREYRPASAKT